MAPAERPLDAGCAAGRAPCRRRRRAPPRPAPAASAAGRRPARRHPPPPPCRAVRPPGAAWIATRCRCARVITASVPSLPGQQRRQVIAGVVLDHPRQPPHDAAVGQDRLEPEQLRAHRSVAEDMDAARVRGDHAADGGRVPRAQVDAKREADWSPRAPAARRASRPRRRSPRPPARRPAPGRGGGGSRRTTCGPSATSRGTEPPTSPVLPPCGMTAAPAAAQARTTAITSSVEAGRTTASASPCQRRVQSVS